MEEQYLFQLEKNLENNIFLKGSHPCQEDALTLAKFIEAKYIPDQDKFPSLWAWYSLIILFTKDVIKSWNPYNKKEQGKPPKKKPVNKSHVILEIKGWEQDQDLEALGSKIISNIKKEGLSWNSGFKVEEIAFGIKKLIIAFLAEDDKGSVQEIQDELESWEDDIQSVEIVSFNKS